MPKTVRLEFLVKEMEFNIAYIHQTIQTFVMSIVGMDGNQKLMADCANRFRTLIVPDQIGKDGSQPLEMSRTKPYGYCLFNLDALTTLCQIVSTNGEDLCGAPHFGFLGMDRAEPMSGGELKRYEKKLAEMHVRKPNPGDNGWGLRVVTGHASRLIRAAGAEPVFFTTSAVSATPGQWPGLPKDAPVFAYHDPERDEKFYRVDRRANSGHLNTLGATEFTELLASDFAKHLSEQRSQPVR